MTTRSRHANSTFVLALAVVLALLAAACGDDGAATDADDTGETTSSTTSEPTSTTSEPEETSTTTTEPEIVLTDSFPGVTAEAIKLGVPVVDVTAIGRSPVHDPELIWQAAAQRVNDDGGVLGRLIDLVTVSYDPTATTAQDAACTRLTEDEGVFAVMGIMIREASLCYTELNETAAINSYLSPDEAYDRALAPFIGLPARADRAVENQIAIIVDSGILDGRTVGLAAPSGDGSTATAETIRTLLEGAGIAVVEIAQWVSPSADQLAIDGEFDVIIERFRSSGVDAVVATPGAAVPTTGALSRNGWDGLYVMTDQSGTDLNLLEGLGYRADALVGSYAVVPPGEADLYEADQAGVRECVDYVDAFYDDDEVIEIRSDDPDQNGLGISVRACQALDIFVAVAELAGPDLTYESLDGAVADLGTSTAITGIPVGSLGPDKRDFTDAGDALFVFDEEVQRFVIAT